MAFNILRKKHPDMLHILLLIIRQFKKHHVKNAEYFRKTRTFVYKLIYTQAMNINFEYTKHF